MAQTRPPHLSLVILAGGAARRMGQDKALLPFGPEPLIARIAARGRALSADVLIAVNRPEPYRFLNLPLISDSLPQGGALVGIHTALNAAAGPFVAVVACDMPFFSPPLLAHMARRLADSGADASVPLSPKGPEPLHAVYRREPCLLAVQSAFDAGIRSLNGWLGLLQVLWIPADEVLPFDPAGRIFTNLNTPADYRQAAEWAAEEGA